MPYYVGFSTQNACKPRTTNLAAGSAGGFGGVTGTIVIGKKFRNTDSALVQQDLLNAFNIKKGEKVGQPNYGTTIWDFIFDPNTADDQFALENEIRRVISLDPRIQVNTVKCYPKENGILVEVEIAVSPFNEATLLGLFFNNATNTATFQNS